MYSFSILFSLTSYYRYSHYHKKIPTSEYQYYIKSTSQNYKQFLRFDKFNFIKIEIMQTKIKLKLKILLIKALNNENNI